ncbi:glycosyltransferase family 4 protein [Marivita sp.]|uniref:glycosyltransferase family 4 protein n=1 Tax=Marivita sp. TaxID=2003365 RepID=UPI0025C42B2F|nr:glycosyltransferase family 4 protein [Marivita sp.]
MSQPNVLVFYPKVFWGGGPPRTCYAICAPWPGQGLPVTVHTAAYPHADPARIMAPALPMVLPRRLQRRLASVARLRPILERRSVAQAVAAVRPGDLCYFWPGASQEATGATEAARARGGRIVVEFINTHSAYAKRILDAECDRIGAPRYPQFTEALLGREAERLRLADAVFAPGPFVETSIRETTPACPEILPASYGTYLPSGPPVQRTDRPAGRPLRFLYVGSVSLRKGAHVLMEAWRRAGLPAELWIAGKVERHIAAQDLRDRFLGRIPDTVRFLGHVGDITQVYRDVDVFVFPSLEEGGPQVTYEAAAYGLPLIVTPMGGGWIARDGANAIVVPPADSTALAEALVRLHEDDDLRRSLGAQALADAPYYGWDQVADRRRRALLDFTGA